jgi:hypothetical protein
VRLIAGCMVVGMIGATSPVAAQNVFRPSETAAAAVPNAKAVRVADINGDGRKDVIVANTRGAVGDVYTDHRLNVYLQQADGRLADPLRLSYENVSGDFVNLEIADLNKDGIDDVVLLHKMGVTWLSNRAGVWHQGYSHWPVSHSYGGAAVAVDVNLDGHLDVVALSHASEMKGPWVFYGDSKGFLTAASEPMPTPGRDFNDARIGKGDLNGDGRQDLVFSSYGLYMMLHDGVSGFAAPTTFSSDRPYHAIGDFNRDERDDVALHDGSSSPYANLLFYYQNASAAFDYAGYAPLADSLWNPVVVDVDRDGAVDLLTASPYQSVIDYYRQPASGGLVYESSHAIPSQAPFAAGDVNGDGRTDLVVADAGGLVVLYGRRYQRTGLTVRNDFNGDGSSDLLWRNAGSGRNVIWDKGLYSSQTALSAEAGEWQVAGSNDFNGDGHSDILWRNTHSGANKVWKSGNSATVQAVTAIADLAWKAVGTGDFDADGRADILWRNATTGANALWFSANSATSRYLVAQGDLNWFVAGVADFDGDDRSDILWRNRVTGANTIWRGGNAATQTPVIAVTNLAWQVAGLGDFDGDGRADIFWRNASSGANAIWKAGNYATQLPVTGVTNLAWKPVAVGDFDNDGRSDVVWRSSQSGANVLWKAADYTKQQSLTAVTDQGWQIAN